VRKLAKFRVELDARFKAELTEPTAEEKEDVRIFIVTYFVLVLNMVYY